MAIIIITITFKSRPGSGLDLQLTYLQKPTSPNVSVSQRLRLGS